MGALIEEILPPEVTAAEAYDDAAEAESALFPEERAAVARAVDRRRAEFATARACARRALADLGFAPIPIPRGDRGQPLWPKGVVGGITHCAGYRAAAVARTEDLVAVGIDAEPHTPLPDGVLTHVSLPEERELLADLSVRDPAVAWDKLLFCAKEAIYKVWYPTAETWLGFTDARVTPLTDGTFTAELLTTDPSPFLTPLHGRWLARDGLVLAALAIPPFAPYSPGHHTP